MNMRLAPRAVQGSAPANRGSRATSLVPVDRAVWSRSMDYTEVVAENNSPGVISNGARVLKLDDMHLSLVSLTRTVSRH